MDSREIFKKVAQSQANMKGDNFRDGEGLVVVTQIIYKSMNDGPTYVVRCKVLESKSKGDLDPKSGQPVPPNAVGSRVGWPQKVEKHKSAPGNIKSFILNTLGFQEAEVSEDDFIDTMAQSIDKEQPFRGMLVRFATYQSKTKSGPNAGAVNTYVKWINVTKEAGNDEASITKRRAELDKTDPVV